jgi:hypothetical protein
MMSGIVILTTIVLTADRGVPGSGHRGFRVAGSVPCSASCSVMLRGIRRIARWLARNLACHAEIGGG